MATDWWVMAPQGASQGGLLNPVTPAGTVIISTQSGTAADSAIGNLKPVTLGGQQYVRFLGPYKTQADAQKASPASGTQFVGAVIGAVIGAGGATVFGDTGAISQAAASGAQAGQAAGSALTGWTRNIEQWLVRGFEMLLGAALIVIGLAKLASDTPAGKAAIKIGKAAAIL